MMKKNEDEEYGERKMIVIWKWIVDDDEYDSEDNNEDGCEREEEEGREMENERGERSWKWYVESL